MHSLNITYALVDEATAQKMRTDLARSSLKLEKPLLVVLLSPESASDATIAEEIRRAQAAKHNIAVVRLRPAEAPAALRGLPILDQTGGYQRRALLRFLDNVDLGANRVRNRQRLVWLAAAVILVIFGAALWGIASGAVVFPVDEYATENAIREQMVNDLVRPTLEAIQPRTTQDALNFVATLENAPRVDREFLEQTATALPQSLNATATAFEASAAQTIIALTAQPSAVTATPAPGS